MKEIQTTYVLLVEHKWFQIGQQRYNQFKAIVIDELNFENDFNNAKIPLRHWKTA